MLTGNRSEDESMNDDSGVDRRRPRRNGRDTRDTREERGRGGRLGRDSDSGRLKGDVDSYRPGSARLVGLIVPTT